MVMYPQGSTQQAPAGEHAGVRLRIAGALMGFAAGDSLGATVEYRSDVWIRSNFPGGHRDIVGGGAVGWRPGEGTDDTDLALCLARIYAAGYSLEAAADAFLQWYLSGPKDVSSILAGTLSRYQASRDPRSCGDPTALDNGPLKRCMATGLVRSDPALIRREAAEVCGITHPSRACMDACVAYCEIIASLVGGLDHRQAIERVIDDAEVDAHVRAVVRQAAAAEFQPDAKASALASLGCAVHALAVSESLEEGVVRDVALGSDADTHGALAGGLLGALHGAGAVPERWSVRLESASEIEVLADLLAAQRVKS